MRKLLFYLLFAVPILGFGQTKISDMPAATTPTGTELVPIVQGGANKKATINQINSGYIKTADFYTIGDGRWLKLPSIPGISEDGQSLRWNDGTGLWEYYTPGTGGTWGSITGTLSSQTDLQSALDAKINISSIVTDFTTIGTGTVPSSNAFTKRRNVTGTGAIVQADRLKTIHFYSVTPFDFTIDQLEVDTEVYFINDGTADVTLIPGTGVTILGTTTVKANYGTAAIIYNSVTSPVVLSGTNALANKVTSPDDVGDFDIFSAHSLRSNSGGSIASSHRCTEVENGINSATYHVEATLVASATVSATGGSIKVAGTFYKDSGGTITQIGSTQTLYAAQENITGSLTATFTIGGGGTTLSCDSGTASETSNTVVSFNVTSIYR